MPVIPAPDPIGLPAPAGLLQVLSAVTLVLHLAPMDLVLGGGFVAAWAAFRGRTREGVTAEESARYGELATALAKLLPAATAFTITLGVAPLLFLQVLYGQLFYTSSVLMAWSWLAVVALILAAYYGYYGFANGRAAGRSALGWGLTSAVLVLLVGFLFVNNMTLMLRPGRFASLYAASEHGLHLNLDDPSLWPRLAHFVVAAFAVTGLAVAILGRIRSRRDAALGGWMHRFGIRLFVVATLVQLAVGVAFLFSIPAAARSRFLGASPLDAAVLGTSVLLAVVAVLVVRRSLTAGILAISLTVVGMTVVRDRLRDMLLAPEFSVSALVVRSQPALLVAFAVVLVAGLATVAWMVMRLARAGPVQP